MRSGLDTWTYPPEVAVEVAAAVEAAEMLAEEHGKAVAAVEALAEEQGQAARDAADLQSQRDRAVAESEDAARGGDVDAVERAQGRIAAIDAVAAAQREMAGIRDGRMAELRQDAEDARQAWAAGIARLRAVEKVIGGRVDRQHTDFVAVSEILGVVLPVASGLVPDVDFEQLFSKIAAARMLAARVGFENPDALAAQVDSIRSPAKPPEPEPEPEAWHWRPIVDPETGRVIGKERIPGKAPVSRSFEAVAARAGLHESGLGVGWRI